MHEYAVTVLGRDRTGIIAETTEIMAGLGLNLTDSTMTRLRGHFAMTLVCAGGARDPGLDAIETALRPLAADEALVVTVRRIEPDDAAAESGSPYVLTVHGADRPGIVAALTRVVAAAGGNVTDLTTRLTADLYLLIAEVDLPPGTDVAVLTGRLRGVAADLGVEVTLMPAEADLL